MKRSKDIRRLHQCPTTHDQVWGTAASTSKLIFGLEFDVASP